MSKFLRLIASSLFLASALGFGQSHWSAEGTGTSVWVGAELSSFNPDYGCKSDSPFSCGTKQLVGVSPFVDVNHVLFRRLNFQGQGRFLQWRGPGGGLTEASYMAGPKFSLFHFRSVAFSGKFLVGGAHISLPSQTPGDGQHFAMAPGFIADVKVSRRVMARAEYEYQMWPRFIGNGGLTPNGFSVGLAYSIIR